MNTKVLPETVSIIAFNSSLTRVAVGVCTKYNSTKCFGGGLEEDDVVVSGCNRAIDSAIKCGLREFRQETGICPRQFKWIEPDPLWERYIRSRNAYHLFLFGWLKPDTEFSDPTDEIIEMTDRRFERFDNLLRSYDKPHDDKMRFNPFHSIALSRAVKRIAGFGRLESLQSFFQMYDQLIQNGIHIDSYENMILDLIKARQI